MWREHWGKRDEAKEEGCEDREGGAILIPERGWTYAGSEGIDLHFKESSCRIRLCPDQVKAIGQGWVKGPNRGKQAPSRNPAEVPQGREWGSLPTHPGGRH